MRKKLLVSISMIILLICISSGFTYYYAATPYDDSKILLDYYVMLIDRFSDDPVMYDTLNTGKEIELFKNKIKDSNCYFEWGMGGSTFDSLKYSSAKVYTVESSAEWLDHMKKWAFIRKNIANGRLHCFYIDIGDTVKWGSPADKSRKSNFPGISQVISDKNISQKVDVVLVDGRFRVACALMAVLNCRKDTTIMIHDFPTRKKYHVLLKYLVPEKNEGTLTVFKIKSAIDKEEAISDYEKYKYIPR
jgi:hypothetical protein